MQTEFRIPFKRYSLTIRNHHLHKDIHGVGYYSPKTGWRYENGNKVRGTVIKYENI